MSHKCLIVMLFGAPIPWIEQYKANVATLKPYGWEFMILHDVEAFKQKVRDRLDLEPSLDPNSTKYWDYRPMLGEILRDELEGFDFWGHTDHDVVYGRLDRWLPDEVLNDLDVFTNDPDAVCGFFSLYRNTKVVNRLFERIENWGEILESPEVKVLDEVAFSGVIRGAAASGLIRWKDAFYQGNDSGGVGNLSFDADGALIHNGREIMAYHFRKTKRYPL